MDEKRVRLLLRDLRTVGRLFNGLGEQYWHVEEPSKKDFEKW